MESILYLLANEFQGSQRPEFHPGDILCAWRFISGHIRMIISFIPPLAIDCIFL